jgi:DNA polymerase-1
LTKPLIVVDFSNFAYACWFPAVVAEKTDPKYDAHKVFPHNMTGKLGTLTRTLNDIHIQEFDVVFVEDRRAVRKYDLWPAYKATRTPMEFDPRPEAKECLVRMGYRFAHSPNNEADDAIATIAASMCKDRYIIICSSDRDLWQLKRENVDIWQLTKDRFVTNEMIVEEFGVSQVSQIPIVKALWGDSGDNVPNAVPRMQKQLMPHVLDSYDLDSFFSNLANFSGRSARCNELLAKGEEQIRINHQLVKLDENCPIEVDYGNDHN